jgi:hypothetical protein
MQMNGQMKTHVGWGLKGPEHRGICPQGDVLAHDVFTITELSEPYLLRIFKEGMVIDY